MVRSPRTPLVLSAALLAVGLLASCSAEVSFGSSDAQDAAVALIESDLADQAALGPLEGACDEVDDPQVGDTFTCTGTTEDGEVIEFEAEVTSDDGEEADGVDVNSTNLLIPEDIPGLVQQASAVLAEETGTPLGPNDLVCPDESVIVEVDATVECELTDPATGDLYAATITFNDPEDLGFVIEVGEQIG